MPRGVYPSMQWGTPPVDRIMDACENITFSQLLLQTVIIGWRSLREILGSPLHLSCK